MFTGYIISNIFDQLYNCYLLLAGSLFTVTLDSYINCTLVEVAYFNWLNSALHNLIILAELSYKSFLYSNIQYRHIQRANYDIHYWWKSLLLIKNNNIYITWSMHIMHMYNRIVLLIKICYHPQCLLIFRHYGVNEAVQYKWRDIIKSQV